MSENTAAVAEQKMAMPKHGQVCWTEIATTNLEASETFYTALFDWKLKKNEMSCPEGEPMQYVEFSPDGGCPAGGMYQMPKEMGEAPSWRSYVAVDNVDESAAKVWELGGKVCVPPTDIPNVGRFCVVTDPTGATFSMITFKDWDGAK